MGREREGGRDRGREVGRERENSNSKTLFYKDCSLGSVRGGGGGGGGGGKRWVWGRKLNL